MTIFEEDDAALAMKVAAALAQARSKGVHEVHVGYFWNNDEGGIEYIEYTNAMGEPVAAAQTDSQLWQAVEEMFYTAMNKGELGDYGRWTLNVFNEKWSYSSESSTRSGPPRSRRSSSDDDEG